MRRTVIYIAGPMTNGTGRHFNMEKIHEAIEMFFSLIELGYAPHCPHLTVFCEFMEPHRIPYQDWLELDLTYVEMSDVVMRIPGDSKGADREVAFAVSKGIPVVHSLEELDQVLSLKSIVSSHLPKELEGRESPGFSIPGEHFDP